MIILAIESSCDETAVAIVRNGREVLANVIASQIDMHAKTGGVVPEVAAREHVRVILPTLHEAFEVARETLGKDFGWDEIEAIAVTKEPGLTGSVLVGRMAAATLAYVHEKPLILVNHIHGHIYSNWLLAEQENSSETEDEPQFPIVTLTVSGGHNELYVLHEHGKIEKIGESADDAAGEAFDKVARMLGLGYPGGPAIQKYAMEGKRDAIAFPRSKMPGYNFSFSGLKTSVLYYLQKHEEELKNKEFIADVAASFEEAVVDTLVKKLSLAAEEYKAQEIHLAGGVSANLRLRAKVKMALDKMGRKKGCPVLRHPLSIRYCTDNAAMIAAAAYFLSSQGHSFLTSLQSPAP
jgi:N6-L-threonylcarbamoyladenine synthase